MERAGYGQEPRGKVLRFQEPYQIFQFIIRPTHNGLLRRVVIGQIDRQAGLAYRLFDDF